ncbi:tetratricopeptide repeat protein [Mesonia hippocampi]|uniref:tetratricopeptide repeat protein n=1 Tax=Mesonia hippocampi TaxID=1628250 RepID=UPI003F9E5F54
MRQLLCLGMLIAHQVILAQTPIQVADSLINVGNYTAALHIYNEQSPTARKYSRLGNIYEALGNNQKAKVNYKKAIRIDTSFLIAAVRYAKLLYKTKNFQESDSVFKQLSHRFPNNPDFYFQRAKALIKQQDTLAYPLLNTAVLLDRNHQEALYELAKYNLSKRRFKATDTLALQALKTYPSNPKIVGVLAQSKFMQKQYKEAITHYQHLIKLNYGSEYVYTNLANAYFNVSEYKYAIENYKKAQEINQHDPMLYYQLGMCYFQQGNYNGAVKYYHLALLLEEKSLKEYYRQLGFSYKKLENYKEAITYLKQAVAEDAFDYRAKYELAVVADNYYKDKTIAITYYESFLKSFKAYPAAAVYYKLAAQRLRHLYKEIHLENKSPSPK